MRICRRFRTIWPPGPDQTARCRPSASKSRGSVKLVEPIVAHFLHNRVADDDQPRLIVGRCIAVVMNGERGHVDAITARPFETLGLARPVPFAGFAAIVFEIPV